MASVVLQPSAAPEESRPATSLDARMPARLLRVPLLAKLLGANAILLIGALLAHALWPDASMAVQLWITLGISFVISAVLAWLALRPIAELETIAQRVSEGDFSARVPESAMADRDMLKLSRTVNRLLDRVQSDRARVQYLAGRAVRARDIEREAIAHELRESLAQTTSGLALQMSAARGLNADPALDEHLQAMADAVHQLNEEMRFVADSLFPGTLGELGLPNALRALARRMGRRGKVAIEVDTGGVLPPIAPHAASALYRCADEALRNVVQHATARHARVLLTCSGDVSLEVEDDGCGFDLRTRDPFQTGLGLFSARAVLALAGGEMQVSSARGRGTHVVARLPARR